MQELAEALRDLHRAIVDAELFLEADPAPAEDDCAALRAELERLLIAPQFPESTSEFIRRYSGYVAQDEHVTAAHARVASLAQALPQASAVDEAKVLHNRHRWTEVCRHRRHA